ncbi:MAG TPA: Zn-dependent hydrolase [Thermoleophilaceae bacterium]|jgi:N-carbamoyl-L-amino-acid hydrolase
MSARSAAAAVSGERLWNDLMAMAEVGATPAGGSRRLALTDEDRAGRDLFISWARDAGLELRADWAGNLFARREGRESGRPAVMTGSHLDTQPDGGRFDGVFGVLAALEAVRALGDAGVDTAAPIEVVVWANEEGGRFPQFCTGSAVYAGAATLDDVRALQAFDGPLYGEELDRVRFAGEEEPGSSPAAAYIELHIEQGPVLEREGIPLGVVEGIRGIRKFAIELGGLEAHAGSPMAGRRDALRAAARVIEALAVLGDESDGASITTGRIEVEPNAPSVVAGAVRVLVDVRGAGLDSPDELVARAEEVARSALSGMDVSVSLDDKPWDYGPVVFDQNLLGVLRHAATRIGEPSLDMVSPAGHDAGYVARRVPTAMLFVPCRDGLSHHPDEWAEPAHVELACRVLADTLATVAS